MTMSARSLIVSANALIVGFNAGALATDPVTTVGAALNVTAIAVASTLLLLVYLYPSPPAGGLRRAPGPSRHQDPPGTRTVRAIEVREGQTVTAITSYYRRPWRRHPYPQDQQVTRTNGMWPTVVEADYAENGEGGQPTVYLMLSDDRTGDFCLGPDDEVTVEVTSS
jgi:hypothetical protein